VEGLTLPAALLALGWLALPLSAARQQGDPAEVAAFAPLVAELAGLERGLAPERAVQRIHALGSPSAGVLFDALSRDELPRTEGALVLGEREHEVLLEGAGRIGRDAFAPLWREAATDADARRRRTAIELVGRAGRPADLEIAIQAATPSADVEGDLEVDPAALPALETATSRLLTRDPGALRALRPAILHASPELSGYLIRAVGPTPDERAFLGDLLGLDAGLDLPLLSQLARVTRGQPPPFDEGLVTHVRAYLAEPDRQLARAAAMALAELQDEEALPHLLELAQGSDSALAGAAFLAMERTTGLSLPRRGERWRSWLADEQRWLAGEGARVPSLLKGNDVQRILETLREVARHRLGRQRLAPAVAQLLHHGDRLVRMEACRTLEALATPVARAALEEVRADRDAGVAAAAGRALRTLGGDPMTSPRAMPD